MSPWFPGASGSNGTTTAGSCLTRRPARAASSSQAFILDRNLAVQFHPEMNSAILASWIATGGAEEMNKYGMSVDELVRQTAERDPYNRERAHKLVDLFLDRVAVQSEVGLG